MKAWDEYLVIIKQQAEPGKDLSEQEIQQLSPEQKLQLERLKEEATRNKQSNE